MSKKNLSQKKIEEDTSKVAIVDNAAYGDTPCLLAKEAAKGTLYAYNNYIPSTESAKGALGSFRSSMENTPSMLVKFIGETFNSSFKIQNLIVRSLAGVTTQKTQPAKKDPETSSMQSEHNQNEAKPSEERKFTTMKVTVGAPEVNFGKGCIYIVKAPLAILRWPVEKLFDCALWIAGGTGLAGATTGNPSNAVGDSTNSIQSSPPILNLSPNLHKSETQEKIVGNGTLDNLFSPRVDNGINTSRQQSTLIDSVGLEKTNERGPSFSLS